tara:strand:- start:217 stop:564 length:348 start_codon:yes stop_codon:yes gene_type:complete
MINKFFIELIHAYICFWKQLLDFNGETSIKDWWYVQLANLIITLITLPFFVEITGFNIYGIVCILPQIAIDLRRLNNFGKDWKWIFINLVPFLGWFLWFIWLGFGKKGRGKTNFI